MAADPPVVVVAVSPTLMTVFALDVRSFGLVTVQVQNLTAQTFSGVIRRSVSPLLTSATTPLFDFSSIAPAGSVDASGNPTDVVAADIDVEGSAVLSLVGFMSGAGGNVSYSARKSGPKR